MSKYHTVELDGGNAVQWTLESPNGPKVIVTGDVDEGIILEQLPEGWTVHDGDWSNGVKIGPNTYSYPISRWED